MNPMKYSGPLCGCFETKEKKGKNCRLMAMLSAIKSARWESKIKPIRDLAGESANDDRRKALKQALPAFMMSATTRTGGHRKADCGEHTNCVQVEMDHLGRERAIALRDRLSTVPHVVGAWLSASGDGLKVAVRIDATLETHPLAWRVAADYIASIGDVEPDEATKGVNALCFISSDPDAVLNDFEKVVPLSFKGREANQHRYSVTQETQETQETQVTHVPPPPLRLSNCVDFTTFDVTPFIAQTHGESDLKLFGMARRLKTFEKQHGNPSTWEERSDILRRWWQHSEAHVDPNMDFAAFLGKWEATYANTRFADGESPLECAWHLTVTQPLPAIAMTADVIPGTIRQPEKFRQLIAFCWHLSELSQRGPFYLGCREAARFVGIDYTTANGWLLYLCAPSNPHRLLAMLRRGSLKGKRTNDWRFLHAD